MKIKGIQKLTLIDYPGKLACTLFLSGCNFRCGYCHNPELVISDDEICFSEEEIFKFLEERRKYLDGVCITGGEPLLSLDEGFLERIKSMGYLIKIDTNGSNPEKLKWFINRGLIDFVSMDIKASREKYSDLVCCDVDMGNIEESIRIISMFPEHEFRTTIIEEIHDKDEIKNMMIWVMGLINGKLKRFSLQGFKNKGKFIDGSFINKKDTSENYLIELKELVKEYTENVDIRV